MPFSTKRLPLTPDPTPDVQTFDCHDAAGRPAGSISIDVSDGLRITRSDASGNVVLDHRAPGVRSLN